MKILQLKFRHIIYFLWYVSSQRENKGRITDKVFYIAALFSNFLPDDVSVLETTHVAL